MGSFNRGRAVDLMAHTLERQSVEGLQGYSMCSTPLTGAFCAWSARSPLPMCLC